MTEAIKESENPSKIGEFLKQTRRKKNIPLDVVHEATKIPLDALKAIEEDYKTRSISGKDSFYYKGFVKIYASYLDVDTAQFFEPVNKRQYRQTEKFDPEGNELTEKFFSFFTEKRQRQIFNVIIIAIGCFLVFKLFGFIFQHRDKPKKQAASVAAPAPQIQVVKLPTAQTLAKSETKNEKPAAKPVMAASKTASATIKTPTVRVKQPQQEPSKPSPVKTESAALAAATSASSSVKKNLQLTVRALQNVWLEVKVDGMTVFQGQIKEKKVETWIGNEKIEVMGKVASLEYSLNDKMIGTLGKSERNAKKVLVTKNGFSVVKN